jgi:hypothetical protein
MSRPAARRQPQGCPLLHTVPDAGNPPGRRRGRSRFILWPPRRHWSRDYGKFAVAGLLRFDAGELDHLGPLLGLVGDELAKLGGRHRHRNAAEVCKPLLDLGIGKADVNLLVEPVNDISGGIFRRANSKPCSRLIAWYEIRPRSGRPVRLRSASWMLPPARAAYQS